MSHVIKMGQLSRIVNDITDTLITKIGVESDDDEFDTWSSSESD